MPLARAAALVALLAVLPAGDPIPVDFAVLSGFDYVEGMELPASVTRYDEQTVTVSGFMQREDGGEGDTEFFMLINDACGCEGTPKLNEIVFCAMPPGQPTPVRAGVVKVTGTLYVGEQREDGVVWGIYSLDVDTVGASAERAPALRAGADSDG
jgi:hypothetical protein